MSHVRVHSSLGVLQSGVEALLARLRREEIVRRIWDRDHTVWKPEPTEIADRLGWLDSPAAMPAHLDEIGALAQSLHAEGYTHALLLGMGGSSLAPEVFRLTFGVVGGHLDLSVLDSTDPDAVAACARRLDPARTLFVAATKSGGTVETLSLLKYFYNRVGAARAEGEAGAHFVAITDPGSSLAVLARGLHFRRTFLNDPHIGGRYSALSFFGLVPALLIGMDARHLLERARAMAAECTHPGENPATALGAAAAAAALAGRDKLTLVLSPALEAFGAWLEQLIAESTGKEGRGILPVEGEAPGAPAVYAADRLFVYLRLAGDEAHDRALQALAEAGHPVYCIDLDAPYDLGGEFFRWEMATAVAGHCLGINPFDQPDVEAAKVLARQMVAAFHREGRLPALEPTLRAGDIAVFGPRPAASLAEALEQFLAGAHRGHSYVALQAYLQPGVEIGALLQELRLTLRDRLEVATTLGYGPRFLHSTGQLHKGDGGHGLFLQFTGGRGEKVPIPDEPGEPDSHIDFGTLKEAQARGDRQALLEAGRPVLRLHLGADPISGLEQVRRTLD